MINQIANVEQGYFNAKEAAVYLGYGYSTFIRKSEEFRIPRCGPKRNRYRKEDRDAFMANPLVFISGKPASSRRPTGGFRPVVI